MFPDLLARDNPWAPAQDLRPGPDRKTFGDFPLRVPEPSQRRQERRPRTDVSVGLKVLACLSCLTCLTCLSCLTCLYCLTCLTCLSCLMCLSCLTCLSCLRCLTRLTRLTCLNLSYYFIIGFPTVLASWRSCWRTTSTTRAWQPSRSLAMKPWT